MLHVSSSCLTLLQLSSRFVQVWPGVVSFKDLAADVVGAVVASAVAVLFEAVVCRRRRVAAAKTGPDAL